MPILDWLDRERAMQIADQVPYRILETVSTHGDPAAGNLLIQGDNLDALKALLPFYRGRVKCIYIDPPYNTRSAFEHYDDNLEHSQWLDPARTFVFQPGGYAVSATDRYRGKWGFKKHFYPVIAKLRDGSEEIKCAISIDSHQKVQYWVRNLERDVEGAFWLPVSRGRFFPDFICQLIDGRVLVVEYKGAHLRNLPTEIEKDQVGRLWAAKSNEACLFFTAYATDGQGRDVHAQIDAAIGHMTVIPTI